MTTSNQRSAHSFPLAHQQIRRCLSHAGREKRISVDNPLAGKQLYLLSTNAYCWVIPGLGLIHSIQAPWTALRSLNFNPLKSAFRWKVLPCHIRTLFKMFLQEPQGYSRLLYYASLTVRSTPAPQCSFIFAIPNSAHQSATVEIP